uniref:Uncharacterized protein n=1 Tax=Salix viminalis TaxID=40686 RepID=A0A6N2MA88_SALVM
MYIVIILQLSVVYTNDRTPNSSVKLFYSHCRLRTIQHMGQPNRNIVLTLKELGSKGNFYQDNKDWHLLGNLTRTTTPPS